RQANEAAFLNRVHPAVKKELAPSVRLSEFLLNVDRRLTKKQRLRIVEQALVLLEQAYVHLPLKRAIHAVDPIQRLKLLKFRITESARSDLNDVAFHREMQAIFNSVRDIHTQYLLPPPFADHVAYLPFLVEEYYVEEADTLDHRFMVSHIADGFRHRTF